MSFSSAVDSHPIRNAEFFPYPFGCWCQMGWGKSVVDLTDTGPLEARVCPGSSPTNKSIGCVKYPFKFASLMD